MAMQLAAPAATRTPMSDINTTPLVDVMLVLLIIFLIAVPVAIQTIEKLKHSDHGFAGIEGQGREPAADGEHHRCRPVAVRATGLRRCFAGR
jgi:hypothetical protein